MGYNSNTAQSNPIAELNQLFVADGENQCQCFC